MTNADPNAPRPNPLRPIELSLGFLVLLSAVVGFIGLNQWRDLTASALGFGLPAIALAILFRRG